MSLSRHILAIVRSDPVQQDRTTWPSIRSSIHYSPGWSRQGVSLQISSVIGPPYLSDLAPDAIRNSPTSIIATPLP